MGKWCKKHPILAGLGFIFFGLMLAVIVAAYLISLQASTPRATRTSRQDSRPGKTRRGIKSYSRPIIAGASTSAVLAPPADLRFTRWQVYLAQAIAITIGAAFAILITNTIAGLL